MGNSLAHQDATVLGMEGRLIWATETYLPDGGIYIVNGNTGKTACSTENKVGRILIVR